MTDANAILLTGLQNAYNFRPTLYAPHDYLADYRGGLQLGEDIGKAQGADLSRQILQSRVDALPEEARLNTAQRAADLAKANTEASRSAAEGRFYNRGGLGNINGDFFSGGSTTGAAPTGVPPATTGADLDPLPADPDDTAPASSLTPAADQPAAAVAPILAPPTRSLFPASAATTTTAPDFSPRPLTLAGDADTDTDEDEDADSAGGSTRLTLAAPLPRLAFGAEDPNAATPATSANRVAVLAPPVRSLFAPATAADGNNTVDMGDGLGPISLVPVNGAERPAVLSPPTPSLRTVTTFGRNLDGTVDAQDNGVTAFGDNSRDPNARIASIPFAEARARDLAAGGPGTLAHFKTLAPPLRTLSIANPATGQRTTAEVRELGPSEDAPSGATADLTPALAREVGSTGKDKLLVGFTTPGSTADTTVSEGDDGTTSPQQVGNPVPAAPATGGGGRRVPRTQEEADQLRADYYAHVAQKQTELDLSSPVAQAAFAQQVKAGEARVNAMTSQFQANQRADLARQRLDLQRQRTTAATAAAGAAGAKEALDLSDLSPEQQLQARSLSTDLFGRRAGSDPANINLVAGQLRAGRSRADVRAVAGLPGPALSVVGRFNGDPQVKTYLNTVANYQTVKDIAEKPEDKRTTQDDLSLMFAYVKADNPTMGVTEGSFRTAAAAGTFGDSVQRLYNQLTNTNQRLTPQQVQGFKDAALSKLIGQRQTYDLARQRYGAISEFVGADPNMVMGPDVKPFSDEEAARARGLPALAPAPSPSPDASTPTAPAPSTPAPTAPAPTPVPVPANGARVRMRKPDGGLIDVPAANVEAAKQRGATLL